jgi:hypothetical protein
LALLATVIYQYVSYQPTEQAKIQLGEPGSEVYYEGNIPKEKREVKDQKIGVSVPSVFRVIDGKAEVTCKNTGTVGVIPSVSINKKEVYRTSKVLEPGHTVKTVISVPKEAEKCVTLVESVEGGKFTVTSKLEQGG